MKKFIVIEASGGDDDNYTTISPITDKKIELIRPLIEEIEANDGVYETNDLIDEWDAEELYGHIRGFKVFNELVPTGDSNYYGISRINSISIISELEKLM
jgi:hypothetical protein